MKTKSLRGYLLTGLVVWLPILVTFLVLRFIIDLMDKTISLLPQAYQPEYWLGMRLPGLGVIISLLLLFVTGVIATNFFGQMLVSWSESIVHRIPLVRSIYKGSKQVSEAIFASNSEAFRKVLLIEYPRKDMWTVAFQTGITPKNFSKSKKSQMVSVFIPTTPIPSAGFLMMLPKSEVVELPMTVEEGLKYIISLGLMQPGKKVVKKASEVVGES